MKRWSKIRKSILGSATTFRLVDRQYLAVSHFYVTCDNKRTDGTKQYTIYMIVSFQLSFLLAVKKNSTSLYVL